MHSEPVGKLKYSEDPADAPPTGFPDTYVSNEHPWTNQGFAIFGTGPSDMCVCHFTGWSPVAGVPEYANLFIRERTTDTGVTRLVLVSRPWFDEGKLRLFWQQIGVRDGFCRELNGDTVCLDMRGICSPGEIRIFTGQPDASDPSRFSIPFQARGRSGWIDGKFVSQSPPVYPGQPVNPEFGYVVKLSIRLAPTTRPVAR
jgi:hypothetical protein